MYVIWQSILFFLEWETVTGDGPFIFFPLSIFLMSNFLKFGIGVRTSALTLLLSCPFTISASALPHTDLSFPSPWGLQELLGCDCSYTGPSCSFAARFPVAHGLGDTWTLSASVSSANWARIFVWTSFASSKMPGLPGISWIIGFLSHWGFLPAGYPALKLLFFGGRLLRYDWPDCFLLEAACFFLALGLKCFNENSAFSCKVTNSVFWSASFCFLLSFKSSFIQ